MNSAMPIAWTLLGVVPGPGLLFGLMLLAAIVGGHLARWFHAPRVIGFVLGGVALRVILHELVLARDAEAVELQLQSAAEHLGAVKDLALGLILFMIGGVFERSRIRSAGPRILRISLVETTFCAVLVFVGCLSVALVTQTEDGLGEQVVLALLLGLAAIATAPAATLFVLQEYESKGPITDTILGLTGVNNVICIILFYSSFLILAGFGALQASHAVTQHLWIVLVATSLGSIALGIAFGTLISILHAKLPMAETLLVFFAVFILLGAGQKWLLEHVGVSFNSLLAALTLGAVFANVAIDPHKLTIALRTVAAPIFAGFFVMVGYELHTEELSRIGLLGAVFVVCRLTGKVVGGWLGVRWAGGPQRTDGRLGSALLCQAAVVIGLASFVEQYWESETARRFSTIILGSVVVFELIGPLLVKRCVVQGGEVKAVTLLRRPGMTTEGDAIVPLTLHALARLLGLGRRAAPTETAKMSVKHLMRTHVQLIPASANLDEVLHLIERSTYSHFPVVDEEGSYAGVIHFSDVRDVIYDPTMRELVTAIDLADPDSGVVPMDMPLAELLDAFTRENVAVLVVVDRPDSKQIVGLVEQRDLLRVLHPLRSGSRTGP